MGGIPSVPTDRSRKVEVIGAGFSRTGTVTFALAMEKLLDGPVMHGGTQLLGREEAYIRKIIEVYHVRHDKAKLMVALRELTAGFVAVSDCPATQYIAELAELYPEAKVICMTRDPVKWWKSVEGIMGKCTPAWLSVLLWPIPGWRLFPYTIAQISLRGREIMPSIPSPELMAHHIEYVKASVPNKERLYFLDTKDYGWEPLCKILDKPVPDAPFPRANDTQATEKVQKKVFLTAIAAWLGIFLVLGCSVWLLSKLYVRG